MTPGRISIEIIAGAVADAFGISVADLRGPRRDHDLVYPRHIAFALARRHTDHSLTVIGRYFRRDHTSVLNGLRRVEAVLAARFADQIDRAEVLIDARRRAVFVRGAPAPVFRSVRTGGEAHV